MPKPASACAGEDEEEGAGATAVAGVPAAAAFVALAGPQVLGKEGAASMAGEVCESCRACSAPLEGFRLKGAVGAGEDRSLGMRP